MSGGDSINQVGTVSVQQPQPQSLDEGVHKATSPQRLNRSSIEALPNAQPKLLPSTGKKTEITPLSSRKITHLLPKKFRLLFSNPKKTVGLQGMRGIKKQNKKLSKTFKRQIAKLKKLQKNLQQKLEKNAETAKTRAQQETKQAKPKKETTTDHLAVIKQADKQLAREEREMRQAYNNLRKTERRQHQQTEKKFAEQMKNDSKRHVPQPQHRNQPKTKPQPPKNPAQSKPVPKKTNNHSKTVSSQLRGKVSWTPEDQALANRLKRLKGEVVHDPITSSGNPKTFGVLYQQLHNISSVEDLKAIVADRRASKITPDQQQRYLGLLNAAVQGMAKNAQYAETMNADLIRDVLKEQPGEAKTAIKQMYDTQANTLQRRLDRLKRKD